MNEFFNPSIFPMLYPTLFPYGIGGFDDRRRLVPIGLENHVKHMLHSPRGQTISGTLLIYVRSFQCPSAEETLTPYEPKREPKQL